MSATRATTLSQRQEIGRLVAEGQSYAQIAAYLNLSVWTVRKWARQARRGGLTALVSARGRPATGPLANREPLIRYLVLRLKCQHPTWGAAYVVKKLGEHPALRGHALPAATTVWRYWRWFGRRLVPARAAPQSLWPGAVVAQGIWQLDAKESVAIPGVGVVTFDQARDAFARVTVLHRVHPAARPEQTLVKLTREQVQQDCRIAFAEWGLPDVIQTDHAPIYVDPDASPFPTPLTLWWLGLGITHRLIPRHTPRYNGSVERSQRTLDERTLQGQHFDGAAQLQQQVDADWHELNAECPSRARGCHGRPPLVSHPEVLLPRRPYRPEWELDLFALPRIDAYLAGQTWLRQVSASGRVTLGNVPYGVGRAWAGLTVSVRFEPERRQFVFTPLVPEAKAAAKAQSHARSRGRDVPCEPFVREARGLSVVDLTGLPDALPDLPPRQLMLPFIFCGAARVGRGARLSEMAVGV